MAPGLKVSARSFDGAIEAVELAGGSLPLVMGVQWHPEELAENEPKMAGLWVLFVAICAAGADQGVPASASAPSVLSGGPTKGSDQSSS